MAVNKLEHAAVDVTRATLARCDGHKLGDLCLTSVICFATDCGASFVAAVSMTVVDLANGETLGVKADVGFVRQKDGQMDPTHIDMTVHREGGLPKRFDSSVHRDDKVRILVSP